MRLTTKHFRLGTSPVTGYGLGVSGEELDEALSGSVAAIVFDDAGNEEISALLAGLADTDFARNNLETLLSTVHEPEDWRVGEAMAESFLMECRDCAFPWPDGRDQRKHGCSLPGADLVGFRRDPSGDRFAFGEVKTSGEENHPPRVLYGRHGLKQQLEDLRDQRDIRDGLVRYLAHRATDATWKTRFQSAATCYLHDPCDVCIYGVLVRDVEPHEDDLRIRVNHLGQNCPAAMSIELFALYLPLGRISTLGNQVSESNRREDYR